MWLLYCWGFLSVIIAGIFGIITVVVAIVAMVNHIGLILDDKDADIPLPRYVFKDEEDMFIKNLFLAVSYSILLPLTLLTLLVCWMRGDLKA